MPFNSFVEYNDIYMVLAPVDIASTITATNYVQLKYAHDAAFLVSFGVITTASSANHYDITMEMATAEGGAEAAVGFNYRKSDAQPAAGSWGACATATSTGVACSSDDDGKMFWIEVPLGTAAANGYTVARLRITDDDDMAAGLVSVHAFLHNRYKQTTFTSSTASASA